VSAILATRVYLWFTLQLQCWTHTLVSIDVFSCIAEYTKMMFLSIMDNLTNPCTRFGEQSTCSKWFHRNVERQRHGQTSRLILFTPFLQNTKYHEPLKVSRAFLEQTLVIVDKSDEDWWYVRTNERYMFPDFSHWLCPCLPPARIDDGLLSSFVWQCRCYLLHVVVANRPNAISRSSRMFLVAVVVMMSQDVRLSISRGRT